MLKVACAIIISEDNILVAQRGEQMKFPLKWEFPGGKIEKFESAEDCIRRELKEELDIDVEIIKRLHDSIYQYETFDITLIPFIVTPKSKEIKLKEHKTYGWFKKEDLHGLDWAAADIPIVIDLLKL